MGTAGFFFGSRPGVRTLWRRFVPAVLMLSLAGAVPTAEAAPRRGMKVVASQPADPAAVLSDTGGAIAEISLNYVPVVQEELDGFYQDLFTALGDEVRVQVLCPSRKAANEFVRRWGDLAAGGGRDVEVVNVEREISLWARDRRIARQRVRDAAAAPSFIPRGWEDYEEEKSNELRLSESLAARGLAPRIMAPLLHLEGGNLVANHRHAFVGRNVIAENHERYPDPARVEKHLHRIVGRDLVLLGGPEDEVAWNHIDMYVTPIDDETVLVADPAAGHAILVDPTCAEEGMAEVPESVLTGMMDAAEVFERFDAAARHLSRLGYRVLRLPAVAGEDEMWMVTYNNVLMEHLSDRSVVYLPVYGIAPLDEQAEAAYRGLGFEVRRIDVSGLFELGGAVRCLVNVTRRENLPVAAAARFCFAPKSVAGSRDSADRSLSRSEPPRGPRRVARVVNLEPAGVP